MPSVADEPDSHAPDLMRVLAYSEVRLKEQLADALADSLMHYRTSIMLLEQLLAERQLRRRTEARLRELLQMPE